MSRVFEKIIQKIFQLFMYPVVNLFCVLFLDNRFKSLHLKQWLLPMLEYRKYLEIEGFGRSCQKVKMGMGDEATSTGRNIVPPWEYHNHRVHIKVCKC